MDPEWLRWARELQAIAQIGLTYSGENHFDVERYTRIREIAAEIMATGRQRYADTGLFENQVYDGVPGMLEAAPRAASALFIATSKPAVYAERIVKHFGLDHGVWRGARWAIRPQDRSARPPATGRAGGPDRHHGGRSGQRRRRGPDEWSAIDRRAVGLRLRGGTGRRRSGSAGGGPRASLSCARRAYRPRRGRAPSERGQATGTGAISLSRGSTSRAKSLMPFSASACVMCPDRPTITRWPKGPTLSAKSMICW